MTTTPLPSMATLRRLALPGMLIGTLAAPLTATATAAAAADNNAEAAKSTATDSRNDGDTSAESSPKNHTLSGIDVTASPLSNITENSGAYDIGKMDTATGLSTTRKETPGSVSVVTRQQMTDFQATDANQALASTTGVTVEQVETDRTYYTARGFDINNFQIDGVNQPILDASANGAYKNYDTALYDHIEVLRGANGLMGGTGTPSATINFVRKKPTYDYQANLGAGYGSWDTYRLDADVSGPLNKSKSVRGRFVAAYQDGNSYLDRYGRKRLALYGVVDVDLGESSLLTLGQSYQRQNSDSPMWGALPMLDANGNQLRYARSASDAADWAYFDTILSNTFVTLTHYFANGWQSTASLSYIHNQTHDDLLYIYGAPDPSTPGTDLYAYAGSYPDTTSSWQGDLRAKGPFRLFGRRHQLLVGVNAWYEKDRQLSYDAVNSGSELSNSDYLLNGDYPKPAFTRTPGADIYDRAQSAYLATRLSITDPLHVTLGARTLDYTSGGTSYGTDNSAHDINTALFAGAVYDLTRHYSVYASSGQIFEPQIKTDKQRRTLPAAKGVSNELGLKGAWFDQRLNASLAVFRTRQDDFAVADGTIPGTADTAYRASDVTSQGYELDVAGRLTEHLNVSAGFSEARVEDADGERIRTYVPKHRGHLMLSYDVPAVRGLRVGSRVRWQSEIYYTGGTGTVRQGAYTLADLMLHYDITPRLSTTVNLNNLTDRKYLTSLYWDQAYYGAPRNVNVSFDYKL